MKNKLVIAPRQTGKTDKLIKEFFAYDVNFRKILVINDNHAKNLKNRCRFIQLSDIITTQDLCTFSLKQGTKLFVDEIFFMKDEIQQVIFNAALLEGITYSAYSTPRVQYKKTDVEKVRSYWKILKERKVPLDLLISEEVLIERFGKDLVYSVLVDPNCEVICNHRDYRSDMSKEHFEMEVLGNIWK